MSFRRKLVYAGRHFTPTWRYLFNLRSTLRYRRDREQPRGEAARIVSDLNRDGIAASHIDNLPEMRELFESLKDCVDQMECEWEDRISAARRETEGGEIGAKTFLLRLLGDNPLLDPESIYARIALHPLMLQIANEYFGMYTQLRYYNIWHTMTTKGPARESQLWHYDREDHLILKLFIYLSDVDESAGPFTYAPGTHRKGQVKSKPDSFEEKGVERWTDDQMGGLVAADKWITATGRMGTILFADTRGFHKGGLARDKDRLLYTCLYTSPSSQAPELFIRPEKITGAMDKSGKFALAPPSKGLFG